MVNKSIKLNVVLNVIKSLLSVIFPLITYPYATRVLGVENIGKINYGTSIITYFSLIASFGVTSYAIREGSKARDDKRKFNGLASELFSINIITTLFSYVLLIILLTFVNKMRDYRLLIYLQSIIIIFTTLGIDWINTIFEDFFYITIRGIVTNIITVVALFIFVKDNNDYYVYAILTVITNAIICLWNYFYCRKYVSLKFIFNSSQRIHLKKMSVFFINAVAVSIYVSSDTTMLGWMVGNYSVGLYSVAVKIYSIMKLILAAIYSVALPRLSYYISKKYFTEYQILNSKVISIVLILLLPAVGGLCVLSKEIVWIIGGSEFLRASSILQILSIALLFAILGGIISQCINISLGLEKITAQATVISAIVNILLNIPFIFLLHENGAAITTAISELIVFVYCLIRNKSLKNVINIQFVIKNSFHSIFGVVFVVMISYVNRKMFSDKIAILGVTFFESFLLYIVFLIVAKNELTCEGLRRVVDRFKR